MSGFILCKGKYKGKELPVVRKINSREEPLI